MFLMIYGIYLLLSVIIIVLSNRKSPQMCLLKLVVVAVLPVVGWLLPLFWPKAVYRKSKQQFDEYVLSQQEEHTVRRIGVYKQLERDKELNIIPIEEALLVSEHQTRRRVMIDVLKQDTINYMEILQRAVSNEDTETSHYAVSAIMEIKRKLLLALQDLSVKYESNQSDVYVVTTYAEVLREFMKSGFLDARTIMKYRYTYLSVLEQFIELSEQSDWAFQEKVDTELILELVANAEQSAQLYLEHFPKSEDAYLCLIKVYYVTKSYTKLQMTLDRLKQAPLRLSNQALTMVRFWSEGA